MSFISITSNIKIPTHELVFSFARSSGPGGQNVNKTNTKATLTWCLESNTSIPLVTKDYITLKLSNQLTNDGCIVISSDRFRSQDRNKQDCVDKFIALIKKATFVPKKRKKTKPTKGSKERRLKEKKTRSEIKNLRKKPTH